MQNFLDVLESRRSIRRFKERPVEREFLEQIVQAALCAPSARNLRTGAFVVVTNPEILEQLRAAISVVRDAPNYSFYGAPVLILCVNRRDSIYGRDDCACAMENMLLCAHALGLGAVWINQLFGEASDAPAIRAVLDTIGLSKDQIVYGSAAVGYPKEEGYRKTNREQPVIWLE